ncbi:MAG: hypothetical protein R6V55_07300 [Desulfovermiculus sp.]
MRNVDVEQLIPHRGNMRLIEAAQEVTNRYASSISTVRETWPLQQENGVSPLVLIELVAQTSALTVGWEDFQKNCQAGDKSRGWLVGIKKARFFIDLLPMESCITTTCEIISSMDGYSVIQGAAYIGPELGGEVTLQVLRADKEMHGVT